MPAILVSRSYPNILLLLFYREREREREREGMNFVVRVCSGGARSGVLQIASCPAPLETPALVLPTRKGLPVFITRDLLQSLPSPDSHIFQVSPLHL